MDGTSCFWVNGGWDGTVVGLSNVDDNDASENDTSSNREFVRGRWYRFRLAVTPARIQAWIDDDSVIDVDPRIRKIELQFDETDLGKPLGFSAYGGTVAGLRRIEYRRLAGGFPGRRLSGGETARPCGTGLLDRPHPLTQLSHQPPGLLRVGMEPQRAAQRRPGAFAIAGALTADR